MKRGKGGAQSELLQADGRDILLLQLRRVGCAPLHDGVNSRGMEPAVEQARCMRCIGSGASDTAALAAGTQHRVLAELKGSVMRVGDATDQ